MELLSFIKLIKEVSLKIHAYILKKLHKKVVDLHEYNNEDVEVDNNYPLISPICIEEKYNGAVFRWSKKMVPGYAKYFEILGNTRRYFTWDGRFLWVKR